MFKVCGAHNSPAILFGACVCEFVAVVCVCVCVCTFQREYGESAL